MEALEPGVQAFSPIKLVSKDGRKNIETYFLILPPPALDAVIEERTAFDSTDTLRRNGVCVLAANIIRGHHFWRGKAPLHMTYFCSDELHDRLKAEKLDGWDIRLRCSVEAK